jgi:hypothetical protein
MPEEFQIELLENGTFKVVTGEFGAANHLTAERLLSTMIEMAGGEVVREKIAVQHQEQTQKHVQEHRHGS